MNCITRQKYQMQVLLESVKLNFGNTASSNEPVIEEYGLLRCDQSRRGGSVACYIKRSLSYNYKENFCKNLENIFIDIHRPKSKPILLGFLYRPPDKNNFVKHLEDFLRRTNILDKEECYLLGDFNSRGF